MRFPRFTIALVLGGLTAGGVVASGCSSAGDLSSGAKDPSPPQANDTAASGAKENLDGEDAGAAKVTPSRGNPLCHVDDTDVCMPDDDGYRRTSGTSACATAPPDAGDAAVPDTAKACRVVGAVSAPVADCVDGSRRGNDGKTCEDGADCAPGFDCVAGDKGNVCRHYCCMGTCEGQTPQSGGLTFCDVRQLGAFAHKVPVCVPLKSCKLLTSGECAVDESCSVVTENGDTGCVTVGTAKAGDACDEEHCGAKLTCLGQPGNRKCYTLCRVGSTECGTGQVCTTSTVFKDPDYGICQKKP